MSEIGSTHVVEIAEPGFAAELETFAVEELEATTGGPKGDPGVGSQSGIEIVQSTPAATWLIAVPGALGRRPNVSVYIAGELVLASVLATSSLVTVTFPSAAAGSVVLT